MAEIHDKTLERRTALAAAVLLPDFTQQAFADAWGCGQPTVCADMKSPEFLSARNKGLSAKSLRVLDFHLNNNDKQVAMFIAERLRLIEPDESDNTGSPAGDLLRQILQPDTALRRENEELKARIAHIEERLGALNGQGQAIIDEMKKPDSKWLDDEGRPLLIG